MSKYLITYNLKWQTEGRKVRARTTYGMTQEVESPSANWARADFLAEKVAPWKISRTITKIEEII